MKAGKGERDFDGSDFFMISLLPIFLFRKVSLEK
jgi:hypothetical protein